MNGLITQPCGTMVVKVMAEEHSWSDMLESFGHKVQQPDTDTQISEFGYN